MQKQSLFFTCFPPGELFNRPEFPLEIMRQYYAAKLVGESSELAKVTCFSISSLELHLGASKG